MAELDFAGLRADVEAATRLPEFAGLTSRAGRTRRRDLGTRFLIALCTLAALLPAGLVGLNAAPQGSQPQGLEQETPVQPERETPSLSQSPPIATIRAIAGPRINALYAAVDVCRPTATSTTCSLQVVPLGHTAQDQRAPIVVSELREAPSDPLQDVTLLSMSPQSLLLSGIRRDGQLKSRRITIGGGGTEIEPEPNEHTQAKLGDRLVQLRRYGELYFVRQADDRVFRAPSAPALDNLVVVTGVAPEKGWWLTGTDPDSGDVSVAVSKDFGMNWVVHSLAVRPGMDDPTLATADGELAYVFVRSADGIQQRRTVNGGESWQTMTALMPWPTLRPGSAVVTSRLGAIVRADGSLLVWVEEPPGAIFLESPDQGNSYRPANGPTGPILAVSDGYVALGDPPVISHDGRTWTPLPRPATIPPD